MKVMFDTNIFNHIVKEGADISPLQNRVSIYATKVQYRELCATKNELLRSRFLKLFEEITDVKPTESSIIGVSGIGEAKIAGSIIPPETMMRSVAGVGRGKAKWSSGELCQEIWQALDKMNGGKENNCKDALIAETAIINNLILVTHDKDLLTAIQDFNGVAVNFDALLSAC